MGKSEIYTISQPPRRVPFLVRLSVLFGGVLNQGGWLFFGFGLIFFWVFVLNADLTSFFYFRGELETARGIVTFSEKSGGSVGGSSSSSGTPIYVNHYFFKTPDGREYQGVSYATGIKLREGRSVTIEYPRGKPSISRIKGMRRAIFSAGPVFVIIFPLIGLLVIAAGLRKGFKANRLLKHGKVGLGKLKSKEPTNTMINKQRVYKLTFEFEADYGGTHEVVAKTHLLGTLEDDEQERLLYDYHNPSYAVMLDDLPGSPDFDETGNLRTKSIKRTLTLLILPAVTIIGHGTYIYFRFFY